MFVLCNDEAIDLLCDRVNGYIDNRINYLKLLEDKISEEEREISINRLEIERELYHKYYEQLVDSGYFKEGCYSVKEIVDNGFNNYLGVVEPNDEDWEELNKLWEEGDCCSVDISEYEFKSGSRYEYIECEYNNYFLIRK